MVQIHHPGYVGWLCCFYKKQLFVTAEKGTVLIGLLAEARDIVKPVKQYKELVLNASLKLYNLYGNNLVLIDYLLLLMHRVLIGFGIITITYSFINFLVIISLPVSILMIYVPAFNEAILQVCVLAVAVALRTILPYKSVMRSFVLPVEASPSMTKLFFAGLGYIFYGGIVVFYQHDI